MSIKSKYLPICAIAASVVAGSVYAADASSQLASMATKLAQTKQFSVSIKMEYDVVQESGQSIEFSEARKVLVSRPNHMRVDVQKSNGDNGGLVFDGKSITLFSQPDNVYSINNRPGNVDGAVRHAVGVLGMRVPLARMLVTTFPQELKKLSSEVVHVERNTLGVSATDHIAGRGKDVDYQVWLRKDNLPARIVLTYRSEPGQPQFRAEFSDWNMAPKVTDTTFTYTPPKGAEKIPTLVPSTIKKTAGGSK